jgi:hypothetical protein
MTGLTPNWKKSERSNGSDSCVEARTQGGEVEVRDSKDKSGPTLTFGPETWAAFMQDTKSGMFDLS